MRKNKNAIFIIILLISIFPKILAYMAFNIFENDTGIYSNIAWNIATNDMYYSDVLQRDHLGEHFSPIMAVFAPFYHVWPSALWILAFEGLAVGVACVLLYQYCRRLLDDSGVVQASRLAIFFAFWALFYPPLLAAWLGQFHPSTFATPFVAGALLAMQRQRDGLLWLCVGLIFLSKESGALAILGLGIYAALVQRRYRLGLSLTVAAGLGAAFVFGIAIPFFRDGHWGHYDRLDPFADPGRKALYLFGLVGCLLFLPLAAWRSFLCAVPLVLLNLAVGYRPQYSMLNHYDDFGSVFLLVAAMHGAIPVLGRLRSFLENRRTPNLSHILVLAGFLAISPGIGVTIAYIVRNWPNNKHWQLHAELAKYRTLSQDIGFGADESLGPYLSSRARYVTMFPHRLMENLNRLGRGDKVLITPINRTEQYKHLRMTLDGIDYLKLEYDSSVIRVYTLTGKP